MKTYTVLSYSQLSALERHGYLSHVISTKLLSITPESISNLIINSNPIRNEFDIVYLSLETNSSEIYYENIENIYPLDINAKMKLEQDFPMFKFSSPLCNIDLNDIFIHFRKLEIDRMKSLLSKIFEPISDLKLDFSDISLLRKQAVVNPKGLDFMRTALLFNENDNYLDTNWKYIFRLCEIYFLVKSQNTINIKGTEIYSKYQNVNSSDSLEDIVIHCIKNEQKFIEKITSIASETFIYTIIPHYLKCKELIDNSNYKDAHILLSSIKDDPIFSYVATMLCSIYNFSQLLPFINFPKTNNIQDPFQEPTQDSKPDYESNIASEKGSYNIKNTSDPTQGELFVK